MGWVWECGRGLTKIGAAKCLAHELRFDVRKIKRAFLISRQMEVVNNCLEWIIASDFTHGKCILDPEVLCFERNSFGLNPLPA